MGWEGGRQHLRRIPRSPRCHQTQGETSTQTVPHWFRVCDSGDTGPRRPRTQEPLRHPNPRSPGVPISSPGGRLGQVCGPSTCRGPTTTTGVPTCPFRSSGTRGSSSADLCVGAVDGFSPGPPDSRGPVGSGVWGGTKGSITVPFPTPRSRTILGGTKGPDLSHRVDTQSESEPPRTSPSLECPVGLLPDHCSGETGRLSFYPRCPAGSAPTRLLPGGSRYRESPRSSTGPLGPDGPTLV